jgi:hypothetical protein
MMSGMLLGTCLAFNKLWNNKFYYKAASCWYFYWINNGLFIWGQISKICFVKDPILYASCGVTCISSRHKYTGCSRRNVPDFRRVFLMLNYTDITQNTYNQSWTITEIMAREKCGLLVVPNTATCTADALPEHCACPTLRSKCSQLCDCVMNG